MSAPEVNQSAPATAADIDRLRRHISSWGFTLMAVVVAMGAMLVDWWPGSAALFVIGGVCQLLAWVTDRD